MSTLQEDGVRDAIRAAIFEAMPELSAAATETIVAALMRTLNSLGLLDDVAPDFQDDD